jgi:hypothetical protein
MYGGIRYRNCKPCTAFGKVEFSSRSSLARIAGCDVVGTLDRYKHPVHFLDYKDAKGTTPGKDWVLPNGELLSRNSAAPRFYASIYDLGDGAVDFPACHRVLKRVD